MTTPNDDTMQHNGFALTIVPQQNGTYIVDIVPAGDGRTISTQAHATAALALASARLIINRGVLDGIRGPL